MRKIFNLIASCFFVLLASSSFALNNSSSSNYDENFIITGDLTAVIVSIALFIYLVRYFIVSWRKVGRDPVYPDVAYYEPPKDISPAFAYYLYNKAIDAKLITCILLDLTMKGCIEVRTTQGFAFSKVSLLCKRSFGPNLSTDERIFLDYMFNSSNERVLDHTAGNIIEDFANRIKKFFDIETELYIIRNKSYTKEALLIALSLGVVPFIFLSPIKLAVVSIFTTMHFAIFFFIFTFFLKKRLKLFFKLLFTFFYGTIFLLQTPNTPLYRLCAVLYFAAIWGVELYGKLIYNITPKGKEVFEQLDGFKKYIKIAEINRVGASNPMDDEKIFCDYLPYAYAMNLENAWMKKFSKSVAIDACVACARGGGAALWAIVRSFCPAMPSGKKDERG